MCDLIVYVHLPTAKVQMIKLLFSSTTIYRLIISGTSQTRPIYTVEKLNIYGYLYITVELHMLTNNFNNAGGFHLI